MSDPGDETSNWPERLDRMEREVTGHGRECADDCVHPDHYHGMYRVGRMIVTNPTLEGVLHDTQASDAIDADVPLSERGFGT